LLYEWLKEIKPYKDMVFEGNHDIQSYQIGGANLYRDFLNRLNARDRIALDKYLKPVQIKTLCNQHYNLREPGYASLGSAQSRHETH